MKILQLSYRSGYSLVEILAAVTIIGGLATLSIPILGHIDNAAHRNKLHSQVAVLKKSLIRYLASGAPIEPKASTFEVLRLLKSEISQDEAYRHVGFTGSYIDSRLRPIAIPAEESGTRIVWDPQSIRFRLSTEKVLAIREFVLDEEPAVKAPPIRESHSIFQFGSREDTWIWSYETDTQNTYIEPSQVSLNTAPENTQVNAIAINLAPVSQTPSDDLMAQAPIDPDQLDSPLFTIGGGNYPLSSYLLDLDFINPNSDTVKSEVFYRINEGRWQRYEDNMQVNIHPDTDVDAFVFSYKPKIGRSSRVYSASFQSEPVQLDLSLNYDGPTTITYQQLTSQNPVIQWEVTNLDQYPEYLKSNGFFTTYIAINGDDPAFEGNRITGETFKNGYQGESINLTPEMWQKKKDFTWTVYAEASEDTWVKHSGKPSVTISAEAETLPSPTIRAVEISQRNYEITLGTSSPLPDGASIYFNTDDINILQDLATGDVSGGMIYTSPFTWKPTGNEALVVRPCFPQPNWYLPGSQLVLSANALNNGHGNNIDGVDVSNPGEGDGGPTGSEDPSGTIDDEKNTGSGN